MAATFCLSVAACCFGPGNFNKVARNGCNSQAECDALVAKAEARTKECDGCGYCEDAKEGVEIAGNARLRFSYKELRPQCMDQHSGTACVALFELFADPSTRSKHLREVHAGDYGDFVFAEKCCEYSEDVRCCAAAASAGITSTRLKEAQDQKQAQKESLRDRASCQRGCVQATTSCQSACASGAPGGTRSDCQIGCHKLLQGCQEGCPNDVPVSRGDPNRDALLKCSKDCVDAATECNKQPLSDSYVCGPKMNACKRSCGELFGKKN